MYITLMAAIILSGVIKIDKPNNLDKKDTISSKPKSDKNEGTKQIEILEKQLEELESSIHHLQKELDSIMELDKLQKIHLEIVKMEKIRDDLYDQLDSVC